MKIIITGAKGVLGQELVKVFSSENEVLAWDKEELDITDLQSTSYKLQASKPDLVINAAAYNDVDGAEREPEIANLLNGTAVGYLAKACNELDIPLVHYSTDYVFDGKSREGYKETDEPNPISAYGESKLLGELELAKNTDKFYLIRLSRLFGKAKPALRGKKSFVEVMLSLAKSRDSIEVVDGEVSSPTYALDLAERTKLIVDQKKPFGVYHCTNSGSATWYEFAKEIFSISEKNVKLKPVSGSYFKRAAQRPEFGILLTTKLPPMRPWTEALKEFLNS